MYHGSKKRISKFRYSAWKIGSLFVRSTKLLVITKTQRTPDEVEKA